MKWILEIIEKDSRFDTRQLSKILSTSEEEIKDLVKEDKEQKAIVGYLTIINWEKVEREK